MAKNGKDKDNGVPQWAVNLSNDVTELRTKVSAIESSVVRLGDKTEKLETATTKLSTGVKVGGAIVTVVIGIIAALSVFSMRQYTQNVVREELKSALKGQANIVQYGAFNTDNKQGAGLSFDWELQEPVISERVVSVTCELENPVPGISIKAEVIDLGRKCRMTITGPEEKTREIRDSLPIQAKVTITISAA